MHVLHKLWLEGDLTLHALSADGETLFLNANGAILAYDVASRRLRPHTVAALEEPGLPLSYTTSRDGRWAYTLYEGDRRKKPPFLFALDTASERARSFPLASLAGRDDVYGLALRARADGKLAIHEYTNGPRILVIDPSPALPDRKSAATAGRAPWPIIVAGLTLLGYARITAKHHPATPRHDHPGSDPLTAQSEVRGVRPPVLRGSEMALRRGTGPPPARTGGQTPCRVRPPLGGVFVITYKRMSPPRDWDAGSYERMSAPMEAMGREVLDRLDLRGHERVLDAGCGTGRVTAVLVERVPRGEVVAVDGSPAMVEAAQERLGDSADVRVADLLELELDRPVEAILSTATFHWIKDHDRLFARLLGVLEPGGRLVAQCGGAGNVTALNAAAARVCREAPYADALAGWAGPWYFATTRDTAERLRRLGYTDVWTWYQHVRVEPDDPHEYLGTVALGSHLERLPPDLRAPFIDAVLEQLDEPVVDYVRLNILARRAS